MMTVNNLKEYHPQKYYLKIICNLLYCFGLGDFWYEKTKRNVIQKNIYTLWVIIANTFIFLMILNEFLSYLRKDLNVKEKGDLILFSFAHPSIAAKILVFYIKRSEIMDTLKMLLERKDKLYYNQPTLDKYSVKRARFYCICLLINIIVILVSATVEGIKNYLQEGIPIRTEVTYLPYQENSGISVNVFRFFVQFHWWFLMAIMYSIDSLSICSLVFLSYKFKEVRLHFNNCRIKMLKLSKSKQALIDELFERNFIVGIKLHQDALRCARKIQTSIGNLYTVQVVESISMLVICLLKLTMAVRDIASLVKNFMFISCVLLLNGTYMMSGGDVTHEASLISDSVFHCGWEYGTARRGLRNLVVITLQQSQVPICMTAFGVLFLSYNSFITRKYASNEICFSILSIYNVVINLSPFIGKERQRNCDCLMTILMDISDLYGRVLRLSYSFFAVMY